MFYRRRKFRYPRQDALMVSDPIFSGLKALNERNAWLEGARLLRRIKGRRKWVHIGNPRLRASIFMALLTSIITRAPSRRCSSTDA